MPVIVPEDIKHDLRSASGHAFEAVVFRYLKPFIPRIIHARPMGESDTDGVDLFVADEHGNLEEAIQCKGFERTFGESQIRQCTRSIQKFSAAGRPTRVYRLVLNGYIKSKEHRDGLQNSLNHLVTSGAAKMVELMPLEKFTAWLGNLARDWVGQALRQRWLSLRDEYTSRMGSGFFVQDVPCRNLKGERLSGGPTVELLRSIETWISRGSSTPPGRKFVVGEFGFGKSSLLLNFFEPISSLVKFPMYVPVSQFDAEAFSNEKMFARCILKTILSEEIKDDEDVIRLLREALVNILRGRDSCALLLDGLDEHPFLYRPDGIETLFHCVEHFLSFIVFTIRKEFWDERAGNFRSAIESGQQYNKQVDVLHLDDWGQDQMEEFVCQCENLGYNQHAGFNRFSSVIRNGDYLAQYGDIPRRPLFLHMLAEDATEGTIEARSLAALYYDYLRRKLVRDQQQLNRNPDAGRPLVFEDQDLEVRVQEILEVLTGVAGKTLNEILISTPDRSGTAVRTSATYVAPEFNEAIVIEQIEARGGKRSMISAFVSNSLLIPVGQRQPYRMFYRFAHLSYHEWFVARYLRSNLSAREKWQGLPQGVSRFLHEMGLPNSSIP